MSNDETLYGKLFLRKWHPQPTISCAQIIFLTVGTICLAFGIAVTINNSSIVEFRITSYQLYTDCQTNGYNQACSFTVQFPQMTGPVFMFYELTNFYQNHRRYVKSKNNNQLADQSITQLEAQKFCYPIIYNSDLTLQQQNYYTLNNGTVIKRANGTSYPLLSSGSIANPCGLIATSFFNDSYQIYQNSSKILVKETGITWPNDAGTKFKVCFVFQSKSGDQVNQWIDVENEHFIVWMRTSGLPQFMKLWGRIDAGFKQAIYTITVQNNYNPTTFDGQKNLVFSTASVFGGKNVFLGIAYLVVGSLCYTTAIFFQIYSSYAGAKYGQKSD